MTFYLSEAKPRQKKVNVANSNSRTYGRCIFEQWTLNILSFSNGSFSCFSKGFPPLFHFWASPSTFYLLPLLHPVDHPRTSSSNEADTIKSCHDYRDSRLCTALSYRLNVVWVPGANHTYTHTHIHKYKLTW